MTFDNQSQFSRSIFLESSVVPGRDRLLSCYLSDLRFRPSLLKWDDLMSYILTTPGHIAMAEIRGFRTGGGAHFMGMVLDGKVQSQLCPAALLKQLCYLFTSNANAISKCILETKMAEEYGGGLFPMHYAIKKCHGVESIRILATACPSVLTTGVLIPDDTSFTSSVDVVTPLTMCLSSKKTTSVVSSEVTEYVYKETKSEYEKLLRRTVSMCLMRHGRANASPALTEGEMRRNYDVNGVRMYNVGSEEGRRMEFVTMVITEMEARGMKGLVKDVMAFIGVGSLCGREEKEGEMRRAIGDIDVEGSFWLDGFEDHIIEGNRKVVEKRRRRRRRFNRKKKWSTKKRVRVYGEAFENYVAMGCSRMKASEKARDKAGILLVDGVGTRKGG
eukprot:CAMPEP_0118653288 /NCGR_PEP_ID=MMETSP0785-20121206/11755_1 /TAXON_ID=91992 /ORGANISM="Bolidomonas pacifica, Strain CCMP 1866" /LENGTH=387 /DNA_ID=CAMNT_0006545829 /DNA_START=211 /DNA_END=1370 /DNA_ORIENTATION=+